MKRIIAAALTAALVCESAGSAWAEEEQIQVVAESETQAIYNVLDAEYKIPYESGTVSYVGMGIFEEKNGAYLDYQIIMQFDITGLSEDEQQWFADDVKAQDVAINYFVTPEDGTPIEAEYINSDISMDQDGETPTFLIAFSIEKQKHGIDGSDAGFIMSIKTGKKENSYNYFIPADVVEAKDVNSK